MDGKLVYDEAKGYLKGDFVSSDCKRVMGTIILYKSDFILKEEEQHEVSQIWFPRFIKDYNEGLSAPLIREIERKNFVFVPVYFDYDQSEIRPEHFDFLNRMTHVIKGHSDLRVKIVGHTDADGSDAYNDELSKRRAAAIINYFVAKGIAEDRLEFDFKGERNPVSNNDTPEGKQLNRRVDFSFI
jgi:outer membrane protein OmpA-like peptidoglycan-associated protein